MIKKPAYLKNIKIFSKLSPTLTLIKNKILKGVSVASKIILRIRRMQRIYLLPFFAGVLIILIPLAILIFKNPEKVMADWWQKNENGSGWVYRKQISVINNSGEDLAENTTIAITVDTKKLVASSKLQDDCDDLRVVYHPDSLTSVELNRHIVFPGGSSCSLSDATKIYFPLQEDLDDADITTKYHIYYGNPQASTPENTNSAFNIGTKTAMLVCPFDGSTTCAGAETPSTEDGAVRYHGYKSGLLFNGQDDYAYAIDSTSLSVTKNLTVEAWVKLKQLDSEQTIVGKWDETTGTDNRSYRLWLTSANRFAFSISQDGTSGTVKTVTGFVTTAATGTWYHIAGVYNAESETLNLYVNGSNDNGEITSVGSSIDDNNSPLYIGSKENSSGDINTNFFGIIDDVRISNIVRYVGSFTPPAAPHVADDFTQALYHFDESGSDSRHATSSVDSSLYNNHLTVSGPQYITGTVGIDGPSIFGSHTGSDNSAVLIDSTASWSVNEWVGYTIYNQTDSSVGIISGNTANTISVTLSGGTDNDWDESDNYTLSPDSSRPFSQSISAHSGIFVEESTLNKFTNPSFENTVFDTSWQEGSATGIVTATTRVATNTSTGTQDIVTSDLGGHTPKAAIFIASRATTDGTAADDAVLSFGVATGASEQFAMAGTTKHNVDTTDAGGAKFNDRTVWILNGGEDGNSPGGDGRAVFDSWLTNGVRIDWQLAPDQAYLLTVIFFAGSEVQAKVGNFALNGTTGVDHTSVGFEADLVLAAYASAATQIQQSIGVVYNTGADYPPQYSFANFWRTGRTTGDSNAQILDGYAIGEIIGSGVSWKATIGLFDSQGFSAAATGSTSDNISYLALDIGTNPAYIGLTTTPTSTGDSSVTGVGFRPQLVFNILSLIEASDTQASDAKAGSYGYSVITTNNQYSTTISDQDGANITNTQSLSDDKAVNIPLHDGNVGVQGSFSSFDSDGWTTNYTDVTATGKKFISVAIPSMEYLTKSIETIDPYVRFGSKSAKLVASGNNTSFAASINPGNTNQHTISFYAYRGTSGNEGGTIDNTVAQVMWQDANQSSTTYTNVGGGWWRLSYTEAGTNSASNYGVWVADGETVYVDGFNLEEKSIPTTFTDGSLGDGYEWSGTANTSASTRDATNVEYLPADNVLNTEGSISVWVNPNWDGDDNTKHTILHLGAPSRSIQLYKSTSNNLTLESGTDTATIDVSGWAKDSWYHIVATWDETNNLDIYADGTAGTGSADFTPPELINTIHIGKNDAGDYFNGTISNLRIFDTVLSSSEITDIYHASMVTTTTAAEVEQFDNTKGQGPIAIYRFDEGTGSTAYDASQYENHLTISSATWNVQPQGSRNNRSYSLWFDGDQDYLIRDADQDFNFGFNPFSISGWFRHDSSTPSAIQTILAKYGSAGYKIYLNASGYLCFGIDSDSTWSPADEACGNVSYYDSRWHHFEAVRDTNSITLYVDGVSVKNTTPLNTAGSLSSNSPLYIGIDTDGITHDFKGFLDEIFIYPYARTSEQVKTDYLGSQISTQIGSYPHDPLSHGLLGYWKLNETNGNALDSSGNGINLTNNNSATYTLGKYGNATDLEKDSSQFFSTEDNTILSITGDLTVGAWIKPESTTSDTQFDITGKWDGDNESYLLAQYGDEVRFYLDSASNYVETSSANLSAGKWYHVAGVFSQSGKSAKIYINGVEQATTTTGTIPSSIGNDEGYFAIGAEDSTAPPNPTNFYDGLIDEVRLYNRALSSDEIHELYSYADGPIAHWKFDENQGNASSQDIIVFEEGNGTYAGNGVFLDSISTGTFQGGVDQLYIATVHTKNTDENITISGLGLTWTQVIEQCAAGSFQNLEVWTAFGSPGSPGVITATVGDGSAEELSIAALRYSGVDADTPVGGFVGQNTNGQNGACSSGSTTSSASSTVTTAATNSVIVGITYAPTRTITSPDADYTQRVAVVDGANYNHNIYIHDNLLDSADSDTMSHTLSAAANWITAGLYINAGTIESSPVNDSSGYGHTGILGGTLNDDSWIQGKYGSALRLNGGTDHVNVYSTQFSSNFNTQAGTVQGWLKVNDSSVWTDNSAAYAFNFYADDNNQISLFKNTSNVLAFQYEAGGTLEVANYTTTTTDWFHFAITWNKATDEVKYYFNGALIETDTALGTWAGSLSSTRTVLGNHRTDASGNDWEGAIDDYKVYNYARSSAQIIADLNAGHPAPGSPVGSPAVHLKFDEGYGDIAHNSGNTGSSTNGDLAGTGTACPQASSSCPVWSNSGKYGKALNFDGSDDYVSIPDHISLKPTTTSIFAWVKMDTALSSQNESYPAIISKRTGNYGYGIYFFKNDQELQVSLGNGSSKVTSETDVSAYDWTQWHHVGITHDGSYLKIYIDGTLVDTIARDFNIAYDTTAVNIGQVSDYTGGNLDGTLDDIHIFESALTAEQIKMLYNQSASSVWGSAGTTSTGAVSNSSNDTYCPPGYSSTCIGPIAEWLFDENTGDTAYDTSTNGYNGNLGGTGSCPGGSNCPVWTSVGKIGNALDFDGSNDYVDLGDQAVFDLTDTADMTITGWFYHDVTANMDTIISKRTALSTETVGWAVYIHDTESVLTFEISDGTDEFSMKSTTTFNTTGWNHFTIVWDQDSQANSKIYINGINEVTTDSGTIANIGDASNSDSMRIGTLSNGANRFDGRIDNIRIYNYARTPSQVAWDYNRGAPVGHWKFDECQGTTAYNSQETRSASSTTSTTGTINPGSGTNDSSAGTLAWSDPGNILSSNNSYASIQFTEADIYDYRISLVKDGTITSTNLSNNDNWSNDNTDAYFSYGNATNLWGDTWTPEDINDADFGAVLQVYDSSEGGQYSQYLKATNFGFSIPAGASINGITVGIERKQLIEDDVPSDIQVDHIRITVYYSTTSYYTHGFINPGDSSGTNDSAGSCGSGDNTQMWNNGTTGRRNASLDFDGSNDYVLVNDSPALRGFSAFSVSAWVKADSKGNFERVLDKRSNSSTNTDREYTLFFTDDTDQKIQFSVWGESGTGRDAISDTAFPLGEWKHVVGTYDGSFVRLYIDGILQSFSQNQTGNVNNAINNLIIGDSGLLSENYNFDGQIDEVKIWNYALTEHQIKTDYNEGAVRFGN